MMMMMIKFSQVCQALFVGVVNDGSHVANYSVEKRVEVKIFAIVDFLHARDILCLEGKIPGIGITHILPDPCPIQPKMQ